MSSDVDVGALPPLLADVGSFSFDCDDSLVDDAQVIRHGIDAVDL